MSIILQFKRKREKETNLVVQWLRLHTSAAGGMDLIPDLETKISHAMLCSQKEERERKERKLYFKSPRYRKQTYGYQGIGQGKR